MQTTLDIPENIYQSLLRQAQAKEVAFNDFVVTLIAEKTSTPEKDLFPWTGGAPLVPEYAALIASGNFPITPDSTPGISDDRDDR